MTRLGNNWPVATLLKKNDRFGFKFYFCVEVARAKEFGEKTLKLNFDKANNYRKAVRTNIKKYHLIIAHLGI